MQAVAADQAPRWMDDDVVAHRIALRVQALQNAQGAGMHEASLRAAIGESVI
jgi:hypothetical protein